MKIDTIILPPWNEDGATHGGDGKTALIVDDQSDMTALVAHWLEGLGYHALTASDGKEAQGMMMARGIANVDLLVTDLAMPRMQGDELARWFIQEDPGARVLVISGDLADTKLCEGVAFLQKPFSRETFMARVDHLLGHSGVSAAIPSWNTPPLS